MLAVYVHNLNPFVIRFTDTIGIRWYGLSYVAGFICAYLIMRVLANREKILLRPAQIQDFIVALVFGTLIGGRIGYCVFYAPSLFVDFSTQPPFWGLLAVWKGGMASHGGIIGLVLACVYFGRKHNIPALHLTDLVALTGTVGIFFGRIANFVNGELFGRAAPPDLPWAVKFPQEMLEWDAARLNELEHALRPLGMTADTPLHLAEQAIMAMRTGHGEVANAVLPLLRARHPSQIYEALLEGLLLFIVLWLIWRAPRKAGVVGAWSLILYAIVRIIGEQFRLPDSQIGYEALGLTRGQWLSILMLLIGFVCLALWTKRPGPRIGGWARHATRDGPDQNTSDPAITD